MPAETRYSSINNPLASINMAIEIDRTQYPISIDGINSDLQDISAKLDILNEFTDGVVDNHLSETEHHLVRRKKRLLVLLRDVLEEHRSLLYDTGIESKAISFRSELSEMSSEMLQKRIFLAIFPLPLKSNDAIVVITKQVKSAIITTAMRLRAYRLGLDYHAYKDEVEENYITHLLATGIYTKFSVNENDLSLYLHTRKGTMLELVDVLVRRYRESQL